MKIKSVLLLLFFILIVALPKQTSAFWWFEQKQAVTTPIVNVELTDQERINLSNRYKLWFSSFEKKDIEAVIANQDKFSFTVSEINYLFKTESQKIKNPSLTNVGVTISDGNINVAASFHKFINGHFSFVAKIVSVENKIRLQLSYVKLYGFSIPTRWLEDPINESLDGYFSFMYQDSRYQGFIFRAQDNLLQLKPEFTK